jgi:LytS/YehU family sensor histidine kinase
MNGKSQNKGGQSVDQFIITIPDTKNYVILETAKYKDKFIVNNLEENVCQLTIPLSCIDVLIDNLKRAADKAKLLANT